MFLLFLCLIVAVVVVVALCCCSYGTLSMCLGVCIFPTKYQINSDKLCRSTKSKRHVFQIISLDPAKIYENAHLYS